MPIGTDRHRLRHVISTLKRLFTFFQVLIFTAEPLHSTGSVNEFLLTGEKRMAIGTNFDTDLFHCGSSRISGPAGALYD